MKEIIGTGYLKLFINCTTQISNEERKTISSVAEVATFTGDKILMKKLNTQLD